VGGDAGALHGSTRTGRRAFPRGGASGVPFAPYGRRLPVPHDAKKLALAVITADKPMQERGVRAYDNIVLLGGINAH
jgi:hypothetical protein